MVPASSSVTVNVFLIVDNVEVTQPLVMNIPGASARNTRTFRFRLMDVGVRRARTIGYRVTQNTVNGGVAFHELLQEYMLRRIRPN